MTHEEEIEKAAQHYCDELECDGREIDYEDTQWAFQDGAQYEDEFILKMVDEHVDRMIKDIPTPSYDYEEGLRKAFISMRNWLHVKLGK